MKKFPQIKWYQDDNNIFISILENGDNYKITNTDIFLSYSDDKYEFNLNYMMNLLLMIQKNIK